MIKEGAYVAIIDDRLSVVYSRSPLQLLLRKQLH